MNTYLKTDTIRNIDRYLYTTIMGVCVAILSALVIIVLLAIFFRYVVGDPINFASPLSKYLMQWLVFLGCGLALRDGQHIFVDMLYRVVKPSIQRLMFFMTNAIIAAVLLIIIYYGFSKAMSAIGSSDPFLFNMSMAIPYLSVPIGMIHALVQLSLVTILSLMNGGQFNNPPPSAEAM